MSHLNERLPIFTERFRELKGERNDTEFAEFLGISRQTVGFFGNGNRLPDAVRLVKISQKCGVSADWLLGISEAKSLDIEIQDICKKTGLSEEIVKFLLSPTESIENFNRLFSWEDFRDFLAQLHGFFHGIDVIKEIRDIAESELTTDECSGWLCCDTWSEAIFEVYRDYRFDRFEIIDFFTKIINRVEERENVKRNVEYTKKLCMRLDGEGED